MFLTFVFNPRDLYLIFIYCRREALWLHADIIMSLEYTFNYISSKTGRIWTKIGLFKKRIMSSGNHDASSL